MNHWQRKQALPNALTEVNDPISSYMIPNDPQTDEPYEYRKTGNLSFELCANFNYESQKGVRRENIAYDSVAMTVGGKNETWEHPEGRHCFARTIDPQLYPPMDAYGRPLPTTPAVPQPVQ